MATYGRGGAGNIKNAPSPKLQPVDLQTPTIKSALYTTGRGGSGNMAINDPQNPAEARAAQDVETPAHHAKEMQGTYHWGRGGEGNMTVVGKSERQQSKERKEKDAAAAAAASGQAQAPRPSSNERRRTFSREKLPERRGSFQQAINKGREMLGLKNSYTNAPKEGSAIKNEAPINKQDESAIE